jgi:hypothetical protein
MRNVVDRHAARRAWVRPSVAAIAYRPVVIAETPAVRSAIARWPTADRRAYIGWWQNSARRGQAP